MRRLLSSAGWILSVPIAGLAAREIASELHQPDRARGTMAVPALGMGPQVVVTYIGKRSCAWSNHPSVPGLFQQVRDAVDSAARAAGIPLIAQGAGLDGDAAAGLEHLARIGTFHEVGAGSGWLNRAAYPLLWGDLAGPAATPQVIVSLRRVERDTARGLTGAYAIRDEQVIARVVGLAELQATVQRLRNGGVAWRRLNDGIRGYVLKSVSTSVALDGGERNMEMPR